MSLVECVEMTDLQFLVSTDNLSTLLIEREEPSRKRENNQIVYGGVQCMH